MPLWAAGEAKRNGNERTAAALCFWGEIKPRLLFCMGLLLCRIVQKINHVFLFRYYTHSPPRIPGYASCFSTAAASEVADPDPSPPPPVFVSRMSEVHRRMNSSADASISVPSAPHVNLSLKLPKSSPTSRPAWKPAIR